jgi:hypothetical protein
MALMDCGSAYTLQAHNTEQDLLSAAAAALTARAQPARVNHVLPHVDGPSGPWQCVHPAGTPRKARSVVSSGSHS